MQIRRAMVDHTETLHASDAQLLIVQKKEKEDLDVGSVPWE